MWTEIEGSPSFQGGRLVRRFLADYGTGLQQATDNGYTVNDVITYQGIYMVQAQPDLTNQNGLDAITITWNPLAMPGARPKEFNDGKPRYDGQSEWSVEIGQDTIPAKDAASWEGDTWPGDEADGPDWVQGLQVIGVDYPVRQPKVFLVWKKWMNKDTANPGEPPVTLPQNYAGALDMVETYVPGGSPVTPYESGGPKVGYVLANSDAGKHYLCIGIQLEADGPLVCRVAKFEWARVAWSCGVGQLYGIPADPPALKRRAKTAAATTAKGPRGRQRRLSKGVSSKHIRTTRREQPGL